MYDLSRHRFKELKHFCLRYPEMKQEIDILERREISKGKDDPTGEIATRLADLKHAVELIEMTAFNLGKFPGEKILKIVAEECTISEICPYNSDICEYYLRKFYWMLSEKKGE